LPYDRFDWLANFPQSSDAAMTIGDLVATLSLWVRPDEDRHLLPGFPDALDKFANVVTIEPISDRRWVKQLRIQIYDRVPGCQLSPEFLGIRSCVRQPSN
jgi:hypothetical protein